MKVLFQNTIHISAFFIFFHAQSQSIIPEKIDSVIQQFMLREKVVGLSLGMVYQGKVMYEKGYGFRRKGNSDLTDSNTNFLTCSISKLFTATAIMQLVEKGKIDIHKKLTDYVPDFYMKDKRYQEITIEHLLTHRSGLPNIYKKNFIKNVPDSMALETFAIALRKKKLAFAPGVTLSSKTYSNTGYDILGLVIERVTGQTFSQYVTDSVLKPAGMFKSSFFIDSIPVQRRSSPHLQNYLTGNIRPGDQYPDIPQDKPCGNLNSCASDLNRWMLYNLKLCQLPDGIVGCRMHQDMWNVQQLIPGFKTAIGWGWWIYPSDVYGKYVFHVGNDPGFSATLMVFPESDFGMVILTNGEYPRYEVWNKLPFELLKTMQINWVK